MPTYAEPRDQHDLASVLANRVARCPDKPWLLTQERAYSYREIDGLSSRLAQGFADSGVRAGDTVLIMLSDRIEYILVWCALAKLGAIEVPVNLHYKGQILSYVINDSSAATMVIEAGLMERLSPLKHGLGHLQQVFTLGEIDDAAGLPDISVHPYDDLLVASPWRGPGPRYRDLMAVMYTSGTTGPSKGATMTHAHAYEYAFGAGEMVELQEQDIYYAALPLFHIAGQLAVVYAACIAGATAVLPGPFSASRYWSDIKTHGATVSFMLGAMANFLYRQEAQEDDPENPLERLLMVPLIPEVEDFKRRFDCLVSTTWGGTEMNCPMRSGFDLVDNRSCGRLAEDRYEVRLVDDDDKEVPIGQPGEALVRTKVPWIMSNGYWKHPDWTVDAWRNQWFHTGDVLKRDAQGNYTFVDRSKDAIRRRGENISSMEVENEINAHPAILECAVIPAKLEDGEEEVMAVLVCKEGNQIDFEDLIAFLEPRMAYFMVPRFLEIVESLPKTPTGKIQKFPLRERGVTSATWDRLTAEK